MIPDALKKGRSVFGSSRKFKEGREDWTWTMPHLCAIFRTDSFSRQEDQMKGERKNILFIMTDQQSASMMSCAGNRWLKTPAMDSIAARGVRCELAFCTNPVCVPARFSLFTGRYPSEIGMKSNFWSGKEIPADILKSGLGHLLGAAGYEAAFAGKEHFPAKTRATQLGFDYICGDEREELADACSEFLLKKHDKPFFLAASFINPHDICHMALKEFADTGIDLMLKNKCIMENKSVDEAAKNPPGVSDDEFFGKHCPPLPENHMPQEDEPEVVEGELLNNRKFKLSARNKWGEREWRRHRWAYARLTEQVDALIGKVLGALDKSGLRDSTVVIFTSDHGDNDGAHKLEHKEIPYEEAVRVPFIIADPDTEAAGAANGENIICNGLDLVPTICDYAGAKVPAGLKGCSLREIAMKGQVSKWRDHLLVESEYGPVIRTRDFAYANYSRGRNNEQLYDLSRDPGQTRNFLHDPECADILERHRNLLR